MKSGVLLGDGHENIVPYLGKLIVEESLVKTRTINARLRCGLVE
ncbi:MAG: hypothetical protein UW94_C0005G0112 [Parcubacteria group bacterium GW2011_GWA2_45_14]|nr:MAG: hypothetical protein UW94_C0005G0112 [Parcubacteria group bacterium GW2011_GWA2_45_14]